MKALQVIENFLSYEKGQLIKDAEHVKAILASLFHHHVNQVDVPEEAHEGQEPAMHAAVAPDAPLSLEAAAETIGAILPANIDADAAPKKSKKAK